MSCDLASPNETVHFITALGKETKTVSLILSYSTRQSFKMEYFLHPSLLDMDNRPRAEGLAQRSLMNVSGAMWGSGRVSRGWPVPLVPCEEEGE